MVEKGTLRTFGKDVAPVSAFFSVGRLLKRAKPNQSGEHLDRNDQKPPKGKGKPPQSEEALIKGHSVL
jgi:hypothetical protein